MPRLTLKQLDEHMLIAEGQLAGLFLVSDRHHDQIQLLTQLAAHQAETIATLTRIAREQDETIGELTNRIEELAESHERLWKRETQTFVLSTSNSKRLELHGAWITDIFNRINESKESEE